MHDNELASVNGVILPIDRATIPVADHGFLYGDSVYETVRTYGRTPFLLDAHLGRLERSAAAIRLKLPWRRERIRDEVERTVAAARGAGGASYDGEFAVRVVTSRGEGPLGYDPDLCPAPRLVVLVTRLRQITEAERETGVSAIIASVRRNPIEALDPRIKSSNLLNNILAAQQAKEAGASEAILFNTAGFLAEGTLTNVFFVKDGRVRTPSLDCGILSGITREILIELARGSGLECAEGRYRIEELRAADEIFLTSTTRETLPVSRLDGRSVGAGRQGPLARRLQEVFRRRVEEVLMARSGRGGS